MTIADTTISGIEDSLKTFTVSALDPDNDPLLFSASNLPAGATLDTSGAKTFTWTPDFDQAGNFAVTFTVDYNRTGVVTKQVSFAISNKNRIPLFDPPISDKTVLEGSLLSFFVKGTDLDIDQITFGILDTLPTGAGYDSIDTKRFSWIPTVFTLKDAKGGFAVDSVSITVQNVNRVPDFSARADTFTVNEGESISFTVAAIDLDGDSVSFEAANLPQGSTFNKFNGLFIWIPNFSQSGTYRVVFNAIDEQGGSSFREIYLVARDVPVPLPGIDFAPTIIDIPDKSINESETVIFQVVATDDGSQDSLKFNVEGALPAGASFDSLGTHIFEWVTTLEDSGTFSIVFSVTDSFPNTSRDTVLITVNNVNRIPQTTLPADTTIMEGTSIVLPLGIIDPDGDAITITYFEVPFGGVINSGGVDTLVWNPTFLQEGVFQLRFTVADNQNGILQHTLQITIENTNRAPSGFSIITPTDGNEIKLADYLIWEQAQDPDIDDTLSYTLEIDDDPGFWSLDIKIDTVNNFFISNPSIADGSDGELKLTLEKSSGTGDAFALKVSDIPGIDSLIDDGEFYWRVLGFDNRGGQTGLTPGSHSFHLNLGNDPPLSPSSGIRPVSDASVTVPLPVFRWDAAIDQDFSDGPSTLKYALELSNNNFQLGFDKRVITEPGVDSILSPTFFEDNEIWYFRLSTIDDEGATSPQTPIMKFFINTIQSAPDPFDLILPQDNF